MGIPLCCQNPITGQEPALEFNIERINTHSLSARASFIPIPKDFFDNLPQSKITRVTKKDYQGTNKPKLTTATTPKSPYDVADDFMIPQNLCIEHEKGVRLVNT